MSHTPVIKADTLADLIALTVAQSGLELRNCLAITPYWGKRSNGTMRVLLRRPDSTDHTAAGSADDATALTRLILAHLDRLDGADGVVVMLFTDDDWITAELHATPLVDDVLEGLDAAGYRIKEAAIIAADGWRGLFENGEPHDRAELAAAAARFDIPTHRPAPESLPTPDPDLVTRLNTLAIDHLDLGGELDAFGVFRRCALPDPIEHLERLLAADPEAVTARDLALLVALIQSEGAVDRTVLQIAFGADVGAASWSRTLELREQAAAEDCEPHDILLRELEAGRTAPQDDRFGRLIIGDTRETPSPDRLHRAAVLLGRVVANCTLPDCSWTMCALVWVRWALGLHSAAAELMRVTATRDPGNTLAPVYATLIENCRPAWVYDRRPPVHNRAERRALQRSNRRPHRRRSASHRPR